MARIVLVHGAFGSQEVWARVLPGLRERGHEVAVVNLPGAGEDPTSPADVTLDAYAEAACSTLADGSPAVLVGHSMGGVVVTQAAVRCPEHVTKVVYVCAFVPADGESLLDITQLPEAAGDQVQANMVVEGDPPVATLPGSAARTTLLCCCNDEQAQWVVSTLVPQPVVPFMQPVELDQETLASVPRSYIMCRQDQAIMPALQRLMLERAGCHPVVELDTDHFPMASRTQELVDALDELAS